MTTAPAGRAEEGSKFGNHFSSSSRVDEALKQSLSSIIADYIEALPDDESHPLLRRKSSQFEFSGSWSVKLKPDGFHPAALAAA